MSTPVNGTHSHDVDPSPEERIAAQKRLLASMIRLGTVWENVPHINFYEPEAEEHRGRRGVHSLYSVGEALIYFLAEIGVLTEPHGLVTVPEDGIDAFADARVDAGLDADAMVEALIYHGTSDNWLFPTTRAAFQLPGDPEPIASALVPIARDLAILGYLVTVEAQDGGFWYIWTSRAESAMRAAYEWDANGVSEQDRFAAWYRGNFGHPA